MEKQIVYGQWKTGMEARKEAIDCILCVHDDINDIKNKYVTLGNHLKMIKVSDYYKDIGYADFYEFCECNYGLKKSEVSRCINVFERFAMNKSDMLTVDEKYKEYDYSQLVEMLPLYDHEIKYIKPSMSVRKIREFKKNCHGLGESKIKEYISGKGCDAVTEERKKPEKKTEKKRNTESESVHKKFDYEKFIKIKGKEKRRKYIEDVGDASDRQGYIKIIDSDGKIKIFRNTRLLDEENFIFYVPYQMPDDKQVSGDKVQKKEGKENE